MLGVKEFFAVPDLGLVVLDHSLDSKQLLFETFDLPLVVLLFFPPVRDESALVGCSEEEGQKERKK